MQYKFSSSLESIILIYVLGSNIRLLFSLAKSSEEPTILRITAHLNSPLSDFSIHHPIMKLLSLFALLAPASATLIYPNTARDCRNPAGQAGSFYDCGNTGLRNYNVVSAKVLYYQHTVQFFNRADCTGTRISIASTQCVNFPFRPLCAKIIC